jgi:hypothetical protein
MKFAIKSEKLEHKDQIIELDFSELKVIDRFVGPVTKDFVLQISDKYEGKSVYDGFSMFQIDTTQLDREEKISEILK